MVNNSSQGASESFTPRFLTIGRVVAPWGIKGAVKVEVTTDFPERFATGKTVYLNEQPRQIEWSQRSRQMLIVKLAGIDTREQAEKLRQAELEIPAAEAMPLPAGEYYQYQILGLEVWTRTGRHLGRVVDILATGSNDVYVVDTTQGEVLIPAIQDVVLDIDLDQRRMTIEPIEGLLES